MVEQFGVWRLQGRGDVRCRGAVVGRAWIATLSNVESCLYSYSVLRVHLD